MNRVSHAIAKVVLMDENGNLLIIRRSDSDPRRPLEWDVPGGWVDDGEDYSPAAAREIKEETGFTVDIKNENLAYCITDMTAHGSAIWFYYVAQVKNFEPVLSSEHDQYKWVSQDEALATITYERMHNALEYIFTNKLKAGE